MKTSSVLMRKCGLFSKYQQLLAPQDRTSGQELPKAAREKLPFPVKKENAVKTVFLRTSRARARSFHHPLSDVQLQSSFLPLFLARSRRVDPFPQHSADKSPAGANHPTFLSGQMKLLTLNFLTCARKACKPNPDSFPLQPKECTLEILETDFNLLFLCNILPRLEWPALVRITSELGLPGLKPEKPEREELIASQSSAADAPSTADAAAASTASENADGEQMQDVEQAKDGEGQEGTQLAKDLHRLLMETTIQEGKLVCRACGHEYAVKEGIANFLLPSHLV
ncbi:uncharacterized protein PV09_09145 [Verruconis gallopava]|uniref:Uncharacterized protein n=1 Tax=Verruconis gallopava TaxID=253628 RepID=A0A0D1ZYM8_9PEZI|nr:uncharacterized protein PV09_09145 [Verruconis gallopava]KIV99194.1 hypothetical protein PV09_09145 [Verruconis gallopava]